MDALSIANVLSIRQKKEWGEILSGFETRNKYVVKNETGAELYWALEAEGSQLARIFLRALRPFAIRLVRPDGQEVLRLARPFKFYFHELEVRDAEGNLLGRIQRRFAWLRRIYEVTDGNGAEIFRLFGPILHPWTFYIWRHGRECGKISKRWSGFLKEGFTDADNFGLVLSPGLEVQNKAVLLGAVFLIDFVHFENTGKR